MKNKKVIKIVVILVSIINIIFVVYGYLATLYENSINYNDSFYNIYNITRYAVLVIILQIVNVILLRKAENKNQKRQMVLILAIIVVTFFIPVKRIHRIEYTFLTEDTSDDNTLIPPSWGTTTYIDNYKNLYGITLRKNKRINLGIDIIN